jgi:NAD(P)-dependent dehydrogenase (short-subunit alcohol dehydrogenase family)
VRHPLATLPGMRILITGSARAIATARDASLLDGLDVAMRLPLDVTDQSSVRQALAQAGELDAVVNNAAISTKGPMESFPIDRLREMFETNTIGPLTLLQQVLPEWRVRRSGVVVNVSSVQGRVATPLEGPYSATKYALEAISETMHYELGHFGIRVVVVQPGYIAPGMKRSEGVPGSDDYDQLWEQWVGTDAKLTGPDGRPGPELVAVAIRRAIEDPTTPLRVPVGDDAVAVLAARAQLDDDAFESAMRQTLGMTW